MVAALRWLVVGHMKGAAMTDARKRARHATSSRNDSHRRTTHHDAGRTESGTATDSVSTPASTPHESSVAPSRRFADATSEPLPRSTKTFADAIDVSDITSERRRLTRNLIVMRVATILLVVAAICVAGFPLVLQFKSSVELARTTATSASQVAGWPYPKADDAIRAAREYNAKLAKSGQPILGEAVDPFTSSQGESHASGDDTASAKDRTYQDLLNSGDEVMGAIKVPKQSIDLPIYHGTSERALASGAGHLYGSSLPVGGKSTHAVITGHRGLVEAMMFTRLDEVRKGDFFYIEVMGRTLGYKVDRISVILPDDTSQLKIVPGEDRVTLMTCTPYGVNTHRLLISGHRVAIPVPAPEPGDLHDARNIAIGTTAGILIAGFAGIGLSRRRGSALPLSIRHATARP